MSRHRMLTGLCLVIVAIVLAPQAEARQAASGDQYAGTWTGTADFTSISFEGAKMTARYVFPLDPSAEVVMDATFEKAEAKGTWSLRPKGQTDELAGGGIAVTKK